MKTMIALVSLVLVLATAQAEPRKRQRNDSKHYILRRQQAYQVRGVPTNRIIVGKREIDIYRNGQMFERDNLVGVKP